MKYGRKRKAYISRRAGRRSYGRTRRRGVPRKSLTKRVRRIERTMKSTQTISHMRMADVTTLQSNFIQVNMTRPGSSTPVFGTDAADTYNNSAILRSFGVDCVLSMANEKDLVTYTIMLVSPKDLIGSAFDMTTGLLSLTSGTHYTITDGMAMVNKEFFTIHKIWRKATGNNGLVPGSVYTNAGFAPINADDSRLRHRWYFKHRYNKKVFNPVGNWGGLICPRDPSDNVFLLIFNDNSTVDLENPTFKYNAIYTYIST